MKVLKKFLETYLPYIFVFIAGLYQPFDADLGWHLKYGEYFFKFHDVVRDNTFSQLMTNYKWPDTDWGINIVMYFVFHYLGGFFGLTILGALTVVLTFFFFSKAFDLDYFEQALIFPFIAYIESPINEVSFRSQLLSVLLLGILFYIIEKFDKGRDKIIWFVIPLFLFWANLHGQFILGLLLFFIWSFLYLIGKLLSGKENFPIFIKDAKKLGLISVLSVLATLIHPFGIAIYQDAFLHFGNMYLKDIAEYLPFKESSSLWWNQLIIGVLIGIGFLFLFFRGELKKRIPLFSILGILYILSWTVRRYAWSFYYLAIPFLKPLVFFFKPDDKKHTFWAGTALFTIYIVITLVIKSPLTQFTGMNWDIYCKDYVGCSPKAADFIIKYHLNNDKLLTAYDWGGWLIWNYPQIKPTIDGRMHLWIDANGYSAFGVYYNLEQNVVSIEDSSYDTVMMSPTKPLYNELLQLRQQGKWILVYRDDKTWIFRRVKSIKDF